MCRTILSEFRASYRYTDTADHAKEKSIATCNGKYFDYLFLLGAHNNMQKIGDKIVYNTIEEILDPSHTALVLWDVQSEYLKPEKEKGDPTY
jgi:hypothetical protein